MRSDVDKSGLVVDRLEAHDLIVQQLLQPLPRDVVLLDCLRAKGTEGRVSQPVPLCGTDLEDGRGRVLRNGVY